jgi:hypothetical protein
VTFDLIAEGLAMQAISIGKGEKEPAASAGKAGMLKPVSGKAPDVPAAADHAEKKPESQPLDYCPVDKVCSSCGLKYVGFSCPRSACKE